METVLCVLIPHTLTFDRTFTTHQLPTTHTQVRAAVRAQGTSNPAPPKRSSSPLAYLTRSPLLTPFPRHTQTPQVLRVCHPLRAAARGAAGAG